MCRRPTVNANRSFRDYLVVTHELDEHEVRIDFGRRVEQNSAPRHIQGYASDCFARRFPSLAKALAPQFDARGKSLELPTLVMTNRPIVTA